MIFAFIQIKYLPYMEDQITLIKRNKKCKIYQL